mmetsp:Transcript_5101/g.6591  ORF Transcript_5101/g.6591 Transcript_5101/m.6591 type:complete len:176 (-) Transcript_5101:227-754(-)
MPYLIFIVKRPCWPINISLKNVKIANHTIGVISTPKAGGTDPLINLSNGSVGQATILYGVSLRFALGYHEITTRQSIANEKIFKNGPKTAAKGFTQASVSDIINEGVAATIEGTNSTSNNPTPLSNIFSDDNDATGVCNCLAIGAKEFTPHIVHNEETQNNRLFMLNMLKRYCFS